MWYDIIGTVIALSIGCTIEAIFTWTVASYLIKKFDREYPLTSEDLSS